MYPHFADIDQSCKHDGSRGVALNELKDSVLDGFACCNLQQAKPSTLLIISYLSATCIACGCVLSWQVGACLGCL